MNENVKNCPMDKIKMTHDVSQKLHKIRIMLENIKIIVDSVILKIGTNSITKN